MDDPRAHVLATARGGALLAGGHAFELFARFGIAFLLARAIGATDYGLYNLAITAGALFAGTGALGLDDAMVRYVAILARRDDRRGLRGTLQIGIGFSLVASCALSLLLVFFAEQIATGIFDAPDLAHLLELMALIVPFMALSNVLAAVARGFKRMEYVALAENVVMSVLRLGLLAVLAVLGLDVVAAVVIYGISDVAASLTLIVLLNRQMPFLGLADRRARRDYTEVFGFALPLWISGLLLQFRKNLEVLLLGALSVAANVGIFAIASRINLLGHVVYRSIVASAKPVLAELHGNGDRAALTRVYRASTRWTLICNVPIFVITLLYSEQMLSIFGASFVAGSTALIILACAELVNAGTGTCGSILDMTGHSRVKLVNSIIWVVVLLSCNLLMIPRWGLVGAALAALLSTTLINVMRVVEVWFLERVQPFDRSFWKPTAAGLAALLSGWAIMTWTSSAPSWLVLVAGAAVVVATYVAVLYAAGMADDDRVVVGAVLSRVRAARWSSVITRRLPTGAGSR